MIIKLYYEYQQENNRYLNRKGGNQLFNYDYKMTDNDYRFQERESYLSNYRNFLQPYRSVKTEKEDNDQY